MQHSQQMDEEFPVIVTSYEMCILDRAALSHFKFKYLVIDEGQRVKNRDCRLVRELKKLNTENRLLLSGAAAASNSRGERRRPSGLGSAALDCLPSFRRRRKEARRPRISQARRSRTRSRSSGRCSTS